MNTYTLAKELKVKRKDLKLTQQALADASNTSLSTVKRFEGGGNIGVQDMFQIIETAKIHLKIDDDDEGVGPR